MKVRLVDSQYWASAVNFGNEWIHIPDNYVRDYERLLTGGIWAQIDMRFEYDDENKGKNPFWIDRLTPIQVATFDLEEYRRLRAEFNSDEWLDVVLRSMGYEPSQLSRRVKLLFTLRLIPLAERNYNLVELGPRGTGKSYFVQEISPYPECWLLHFPRAADSGGTPRDGLDKGRARGSWPRPHQHCSGVRDPTDVHEKGIGYLLSGGHVIAHGLGISPGRVGNRPCHPLDPVPQKAHR